MLLKIKNDEYLSLLELIKIGYYCTDDQNVVEKIESGSDDFKIKFKYGTNIPTLERIVLYNCENGIELNTNCEMSEECTCIKCIQDFVLNLEFKNSISYEKSSSRIKDLKDLKGSELTKYLAKLSTEKYMARYSCEKSKYKKIFEYSVLEAMYDSIVYLINFEKWNKNDIIYLSGGKDPKKIEKCKTIRNIIIEQVKINMDKIFDLYTMDPM